MNSVEDRVHAAMSAAADLAAREIPTAPPLRLPSEPTAGDRRRHVLRRHTQGRWIRWAAPLAAAAAVVTLAISLVTVKDIQNGGAVPSNPATSAGPTASTGPDGVPRYYVALEGPSANAVQPYHIVVGDVVTGKVMATFAPPKNTRFESVTSAADDRTFVVTAVTSSNGSFLQNSKGTLTGSWYEVQLAPGTANPVRLTALAISPRSAVFPINSRPTDPALTAGYFATTALSGSGQQLAVAEYTGWNGMTVKVFSVATGQLLHDWTFTDPSLPPPPKNGLWFSLPAMTWIDGDQRLAFETSDLTHLGSATRRAQVVRELNVAGPPTDDLLTDSKVVWVGPITKYPAGRVQSPAEVLQRCTESLGSSDVLVSADGKTFSCTTQLTSDGYTQSFRTYPLTANATAAEQGSTDYQVTHAEAKGLDTPMVLWSSPTGDTLIGAWNTYAKGTLTDAAGGLHIGVISHGKFTPLQFPKGFTLGGDSPPQIAF